MSLYNIIFDKKPKKHRLDKRQHLQSDTDQTEFIYVQSTKEMIFNTKLNSTWNARYYESDRRA